METPITTREFETAGEALQHAPAGGRVIRLDGVYHAVNRADAHRLEAAGVSFAYVVNHRLPSGDCRIVTVPVN